METTDVFLDLHLKSHRRSAALSLAAAAAAAVLTLTACSSNSGHTAQGAPPPLTPGAGQSLAGLPGSTATGAASGTTTMPPMTMPSTSTNAAQAPVAGDAVSIKNFAFAPAAMTVKVGTTVTWTNEDSDAHTVTSTGGGGPLKSSPLNNGQTYTHTFTAVGTYSYFCTIHPFMTATVTVTA
jgi:plastocyanin